MDTPQFWAITNGTDRKIVGRFHGVDYVWQPGEVANVPHEAAVHIFGVGVDDKAAALHRLGWLTMIADMDSALARLKLIKFEPVRQVFEMAPARTKRSRKAAEATAVAADDNEPGDTEDAAEVF